MKKGYLSIALIIGAVGIIIVCFYLTKFKETKSNNGAKPLGTVQGVSGKNHQNDSDINKVVTTGEYLGEFTGISVGDYQHFDVKDSQGTPDSFYISAKVDRELFKKFQEDPAMVGKKVRIGWQEVIRFIPEANMKLTIKEIVKLELVND